MNIFDTVDGLPRRSQIVLVAHVLRAIRPSIKDLAAESGCHEETVAGWMRTYDRRFMKPRITPPKATQ